MYWYHKLKMDRWWMFKFSGAVTTWSLLQLQSGAFDFSAAAVCRFALLLVLFVFIAFAGQSLNDYFDYDADCAAGKHNVFQALPGGKNAVWIAVFCLSALIFAALSDASGVLLMLTATQLLLNVVYSAPPFRLKERGICSVLVTGFYERAFPYYMIYYWTTGALLPDVFFALYLLWAYIWECRNFLMGQFSDFESDLRHGVRSVVVVLGLKRIRRWMASAYLMELAALFAWFWFSLLSTRGPDYFWILLSLLFTVKLLWDEALYLKDAWLRTDEIYNKVFLVAVTAALALKSPKGVILFSLAHLMFYPAFAGYYHFVYYFLWHKCVLATGFPFLRWISAYVVNHTIYQFRKRILGWDEFRSRGGRRQTI